MIIRWHQVDGTDRIAVDWREFGLQHRSVYVVEHDSHGLWLEHVDGKGLELDQIDELTEDVIAFEAHASSRGATPRPGYYAGVLAALESQHTTEKGKPT